MKNKVWLAVNLLLLLSIVFWSFNAPTQAQKKDVWEYKTYRGTLNSLEMPDEKLNAFGQEGWELVAIEQRSESSSAPYYIFKRRK